MDGAIRRSSIAAASLLAGCATGTATSVGTEAANAAKAAPSATPSQIFGPGTGVLTVSFRIPRAAKASKVRVKPNYISPATNSVTVGVDGTTAATAASTCAATTCTVTLDLPLGPHTLAVRLWDAPSGGGNELASNTAASCAVASGSANACLVTMFGTASSLQMTTTSAAVSGSQVAGFTFLSASATPFTIDALDADGFQILGVGAVTPSVSTAGSGITIATPAPNASPVYGITDQNPAAQTLAIASTPAPNSDGAALSTNVTISGETCAQNAITGQGVPLGAAASFAVLGGTTVTNAGGTVVTGNLGVSPGSSITGFGPGVVVDGAIHDDDSTAMQAHADLTTAYGNAGARVSTGPAGADLGGQTFTPGVYLAPTSLALTGNVTLDGENDPNSVFIFQIGTSFGIAGSSNVFLINKADACNVFWAVGTSATIAASANVQGTLLVNTSVSLAAGVSIQGRVLAETGAVTMSDNAVTLTRP